MPPLDYWHKLTRTERFGTVSDFWRLDVESLEKALIQHPPEYWHEQGRRRALRLFHLAAERVPAYKAFLRRHAITPHTVRTLSDFEQVPFTDKKNYITKYALASRCWDGNLHDASLVAVSSGTSGAPTLWPRGGRQEMEAALIHELAYRSLFQIHTKKTLAVIGFPMGIYVSGVATLLPTWLITQREYPLTTVSVGNQKDQALKIIKEIGADFEQVLVIGHPFFVKDLIETGKRERVSWKKLNMNMLFCSEGFSESWRSYVQQQAGLRPGAVSALSTYGSSELLLMGHETPTSVAIRRAMKSSDTPNLFQYNPLLRFIQTHEQELLFTADSGTPLIRFNLHDAGDIMSFAEGASLLNTVPRDAWKLPFVSLRGRADHTLVFYAANIYPEHVHTALNERAFLTHITGKFTMEKQYNRKQEAQLNIHVELQPTHKANKTLEKKLTSHVFHQLKQLNLEFRDASSLGKDLTPRIVLRPYQDTKYFKPGLKPRYIIKSKV